jgi:hypothetical protein
VNNLQHTRRRPQPKTFAAYLLLTGTWLVALVIVASPIPVRVFSASLRADAHWWDRADAVSITICLLLQSVLGTFLLWRSGSSKAFAWHVVKGVAYGILSFLITVPLAFLIMKTFYKPIITMPPVLFFALIFYLGHRIPLLGVVLGGFLAAAVHWALTESKAQAELG